ncbi:MAG TPA: DUF3606 domain-containing protein [Bacteroidia bacterium]
MEPLNYSPDEMIPLNETGIRDWSEKINCDTKDLWDAVLKVGSKVNCVMAYLEMNCKIKGSE